MKASSLDVREQVLRAVDQGYAREEMVKLLGLWSAPIKRSVKQRRETGTVAPQALPGRPPKPSGPLQAELVAQLRAHEDLRLEDQCQWWEQAQGVKVSLSTMSRAIKRVGWTRKNRHWQPVNVVRKSERRGANR